MFFSIIVDLIRMTFFSSVNTSSDHPSNSYNSSSSVWVISCVSLGLASIMGSSFFLLDPEHFFFRFLFASPLSQALTLSLFWGGMGVALSKWRRQKQEWSLYYGLQEEVQTRLSPSVSSEPTLSSPSVPSLSLLDQLSDLSRSIRTFQHGLAGSFFSHILTHFIGGVPSRDELNRALEQQRDRCYEKLEGDYKALTSILWLIPLCGFLGTVLGMSSSIASLDQVVSQKGASLDTLIPAVQGLATAFDTTLLALFLVIPLKLIEVYLDRNDQHLIEMIDTHFGHGLMQDLNLQGLAQHQETHHLNQLNELTNQVNRQMSQLTQRLQSLNHQFQDFPIKGELIHQLLTVQETQTTLLKSILNHDQNAHLQILKTHEDLQNLIHQTSVHWDTLYSKPVMLVRGNENKPAQTAYPFQSKSTLPASKPLQRDVRDLNFKHKSEA